MASIQTGSLLVFGW